MVLESDSITGLDRKVLKRILSDAGGSLSLAELQEKLGKVVQQHLAGGSQRDRAKRGRYHVCSSKELCHDAMRKREQQGTVSEG